MKKTQQDNIWGPEKFNREMKSLGELTSSFGLPRMIITGFLVLPVSTFHFTVVAGCIRTDEFVPDAWFSGGSFKQGG